MFLRIAEYAVTIVAPEQYSAGLVFCIFKMPNAFFASNATKTSCTCKLLSGTQPTPKRLCAVFSMPENFLHFRVSETEIQAVWEGLHCPDFQSDGKEKSPESLGITGVQDSSFWF